MEEAPGVPLYGTSWGGSIEDMIEELEHRIPGLFDGDECPLELSTSTGCSCTYETGCIAIRNKKEFKINRQVKRVMKNDKKVYNDT